MITSPESGGRYSLGSAGSTRVCLSGENRLTQGAPEQGVGRVFGANLPFRLANALDAPKMDCK